MKQTFLIIVVLVLTFTRCAQIVPLTGGARDSTPPKLLESTPANRAVNFSGNEIKLVFDEFVQLRDLPNELIISPRFEKTPEITAEGKEVVVKIEKGELKPNTTYRFAFGKAIADMNESNSLKDFEFVFSTGPVIDTLKITGKVTEGFTALSMADMLVGLYRGSNFNDSLPYNKQADYQTRSNEGGNFLFNNLPSGQYHLYAIGDKNKNGQYDGEAEKVAFYPEEIDLRKDSVYDLSLFQEEPTRSFFKKSVSSLYGVSQIILSKNSRVDIKPLLGAGKGTVFIEKPLEEQDTILVYYKDVKDTLVLQLNNITASKTDTLRLLLPKVPSKRTQVKYSVLFPVAVPKATDQVRILFVQWMDTSVKRLERLMLTSIDDTLINKEKLQGSWNSSREFNLKVRLKEGKTYQLKIDTGAFVTINGYVCDSSRTTSKTKTKTEFGHLTLKVKLNRKQPYIIQLINEQMAVVEERAVNFSLSSSNLVTLDFAMLQPGNYTTRIIYDDNANGKWDTGNLLRKKQPEKVFISTKSLKVMADWEIEEEIAEK